MHQYISSCRYCLYSQFSKFSLLILWIQQGAKINENSVCCQCDLYIFEIFHTSAQSESLVCQLVTLLYTFDYVNFRWAMKNAAPKSLFIQLRCYLRMPQVPLRRWQKIDEVCGDTWQSRPAVATEHLRQFVASYY